MKFIFLKLLIILVLSSCSNMSKNMVQEGEFELVSGVFEEKKWDSTLRFKRLSWYQELNMLFDLLVVPVDANSPFSNWLSEDEKNDFSDCSSKFIALYYHLNTKKISRKSFEKQIKNQGFKNINLNHFKSNLSLHPDFTANHLRLYKLQGLCGLKKVINVKFPGFSNKSLAF